MGILTARTQTLIRLQLGQMLQKSRKKTCFKRLMECDSCDSTKLPEVASGNFITENLWDNIKSGILTAMDNFVPSKMLKKTRHHG